MTQTPILSSVIFYFSAVLGDLGGCGGAQIRAGEPLQELASAKRGQASDSSCNLGPDWQVSGSAWGGSP